jgi:hypothetical protein
VWLYTEPLWNLPRHETWGVCHSRFLHETGKWMVVRRGEARRRCLTGELMIHGSGNVDGVLAWDAAPVIYRKRAGSWTQGCGQRGSAVVLTSWGRQMNKHVDVQTRRDGLLVR